MLETDDTSEYEGGSNINGTGELDRTGDTLMDFVDGVLGAGEKESDGQTPDAVYSGNLTHPLHQWVDHVPDRTVEVQVYPVERRWEYSIYDPRMERISKEPTKEHYKVRMKSGSSKKQPHNLFVDDSEREPSDEDVPRIIGRSRSNKRRRNSLHREISSESDPLDEDSDSDLPRTRKKLKRKSVRSIRSTTSRHINYYYGPASSDLESDMARPRLGRRGHPSRDFGPTRRSERTGRLVGSMRERGENDIPEADNRGPSQSVPKHVGVKETFMPLAKNDRFRLRHCLTCDTCNDMDDNVEKGPLVYCQGCTLAYHRQCLGPRNSREHLVTKIGDNDFVLQCRRCVESARRKEVTAPRQSKCAVCYKSGSSCKPFRERKTSREEQKEREDNLGEDPISQVALDLINNVQNVMFRCVSCYQAFHMHHLPSRAENVLEGDDIIHKADDRFHQYCRDWTCTDCSSAPTEVGVLIAWRPTDAQYETGQTVDEVDEDDKEYLLKWKNMSYYKSTWRRGSWVWAMTARSMRLAFARKENGNNLPKLRTEDAIPEDYLRVDIVFDVRYSNVVNARIEEVDLARIKEIAKARVKFKGLGYEDVVWEEPPDPEDTERWADFKAAYEDWVRSHYIRLPSINTVNAHLRKIKARGFKAKVELKEQPKGLTGGTLMDYQLDGINWLLFQWFREQNAILADEMGLGKTIQVIGFLASLQNNHGCWPFLVVVPNATCANWRREIKQWAPSLRVVTYFGSSKARELAYKYELCPDKPGDLRCHVVVTSYDAAQDDSCQKFLKRIHWAGLVIDEGQRLKNDKSLLYAALTALRTPFRLLLTGTPLQNNQRELFNLLQFCDKSINAQDLEDKYAELTKENVLELHDMLRPFFLRRTKAQVLTFLPPMAQIIVPVSLSSLQKQLYKSVLAKNSDLLKSIFGGDKKVAVKGLRNLLMQLRKCLCHPFVYSMEIEERSTNPIISHRRLVEASSKFQLLEIMLPKLQQRGHRVLIFSQFLDMLTVTEDFLDGLALNHLRLDGSMGSLEKQKVIDQYNASDSQVFALLLSTRAGGVGINLATADTVIILDPDFNPHQDIQAISRAHRIGQKKKVLIFQLMTRQSVEEKIMQIGKKKMALDHVLIEQMDAEDADGNDLESVLRFGAEALFKDDDTHDIRYDSASVDKLLDRSQVEDTKTGHDHSAESQFGFARIWQNDSGTMEEEIGASSEDDEHQADQSVWEKILEERGRQAEAERRVRADTFGRGKRQRQNVNYKGDAHDPWGPDKQDDSDTDFQARAESGAEDSAVEDVDESEARKLSDPPARPPSSSTIVQPAPEKVHTYQRAQVPKPAVLPIRATETLPCLACNFDLGPHAVGSCPLKRAGVEACNLCGLAHFGHMRVCPHLQSETQVRMMLETLNESREDKALVDKARKQLKGLKGNLVHLKRRRKAEAAAATAAAAVADGGFGPVSHGSVNGQTMASSRQGDAPPETTMTTASIPGPGPGPQPTLHLPSGEPWQVHLPPWPERHYQPRPQPTGSC